MRKLALGQSLKLSQSQSCCETLAIRADPTAGAVPSGFLELLSAFVRVYGMPQLITGMLV